MSADVAIVGAGLAGCEAAFQLASKGCSVQLIDMKPNEQTPAHQIALFGELVCSNSLRSNNLLNAVGLLKEEMQRLGSLVMAASDATRVPAGDALAVDRIAFAEHITQVLAAHPRIQQEIRHVTSLSELGDGPVLLATGPLTSLVLSKDIVQRCGAENLSFYDAMAPIVSAETIDQGIAFAASRYGKGGGSDYLNCPFTKDEYQAFVKALVTAECTPLHAFESPNYFAACLPVEVVAGSGEDALRFGCMKPVGLEDPKTHSQPYAVVQLRQEDTACRAYNLVGFQTKLKTKDQRRVFRMIPGLEQADFLRFGAVHRNTYLQSPKVLDERMTFKAAPNIRFCGQITGVEGYVESAAHGLITALLFASDLNDKPVALPPKTTCMGALLGHVRGHGTQKKRAAFEPHNVHWGLFPPIEIRAKKQEKKRLRAQRAIRDFEQWAEASGFDLGPRSIRAQEIIEA